MNLEFSSSRNLRPASLGVARVNRPQKGLEAVATSPVEPGTMYLAGIDKSRLKPSDTPAKMCVAQAGAACGSS